MRATECGLEIDSVNLNNSRLHCHLLLMLVSNEVLIFPFPISTKVCRILTFFPISNNFSQKLFHFYFKYDIMYPPNENQRFDLFASRVLNRQHIILFLLAALRSRALNAVSVSGSHLPEKRNFLVRRRRLNIIC